MTNLRILLAVLALAAPTCLGGNLEKLESSFLSSEKQIRVRDMLVRMGLMKEWSEHGEKRIHIGVGDGLGFDRTYRAQPYDDIVSITLAGKGPASGDYAKRSSVLVTYVAIVEQGRYQVYRWKDGAYKKVETARIEKKTSLRRKNEKPNKSQK